MKLSSHETFKHECLYKIRLTGSLCGSSFCTNEILEMSSQLHNMIVSNCETVEASFRQRPRGKQKRLDIRTKIFSSFFGFWAWTASLWPRKSLLKHETRSCSEKNLYVCNQVAVWGFWTLGVLCYKLLFFNKRLSRDNWILQTIGYLQRFKVDF